MLSNTLQEQDPLNLKINKDKNVFDQDTINRHNHYISSNCPDSKWIHLSVFLNSENPLRKNCYAPLMSQVEINNPEIVPCINLVQSIFNGHNEKEYIKFEMSKENLQKAIDNYWC